MICPRCAEPVHPANERHGHCNMPRCAGYADGFEDGEAAGRLAIIRAEVERHARQLEVFIEAVTSRAILFDAVFHAKTTRAGMDLEVGFRDGSGHDARVMLADLTRWLEATR